MQLTRKLSGPLDGALAAGGDPATSPLYVFGPFLRLVIPAGVASVTYGASIWLAVLTVSAVSAVYRRVMVWVTDGSGGSGLSEEEFGPWAAKLSAGITFIEYALTLLVSMSALVTFLADRIHALQSPVAGAQLRLGVAIVLTLLVAVVVNRGPRVATAAFGPATAALLALLWVMIAASIWHFGLRLPPFRAEAFSAVYLESTLGGFARILALMTGIEVFANLVAAYDGSPRERGQKAFGSLAIVMGTTGLTMLIVGPAIFSLADVERVEVSVFTQTMDALLPPPLAYAGSLVGVAVLLSASATAMLGIQNLALGLSHRHYLPARLGQRNRFGVAGAPVWCTALVATACFVLFGTHEATYLALYAAGVFVLLSITCWATVRRLLRERRGIGVLGAVVAASFTSTATAVIFAERFQDGAWLYLVLVPALYVGMSAARRARGTPSIDQDCLGRCLACSCPGLGPPSIEENRGDISLGGDARTHDRVARDATRP
jgi:hypothetical protein